VEAYRVWGVEDDCEIVRHTRRPRFIPQEHSWYSFLSQAESAGRIKLIEKLSTTSGIEPATFRPENWMRLGYNVTLQKFVVLKQQACLHFRTASGKSSIEMDNALLRKIGQFRPRLHGVIHRKIVFFMKILRRPDFRALENQTPWPESSSEL
jgi:hypothetical protein